MSPWFQQPRMIPSAFTQWRGAASAWTWSLSSFDQPGAINTSNFHQHIHVQNHIYIICHSALTWTVVNRWHFSCLKYAPVAFSHFSPDTHILRFPSVIHSAASGCHLKVTEQSRCLRIYHSTCLASGLKIKSSFWAHFCLNHVTAQCMNVLLLSLCQWWQGLERVGCWVIKKNLTAHLRKKTALMRKTRQDTENQFKVQNLGKKSLWS